MLATHTGKVCDDAAARTAVDLDVHAICLTSYRLISDGLCFRKKFRMLSSVVGTSATVDDSINVTNPCLAVTLTSTFSRRSSLSISRNICNDQLVVAPEAIEDRRTARRAMKKQRPPG